METLGGYWLRKATNTLDEWMKEIGFLVGVGLLELGAGSGHLNGYVSHSCPKSF